MILKLNRLKKYFKKGIYILIIGLSILILVNYFVKNDTKKAIFYDVKSTPYTEVGIVFGAGINGNKPGKYLKDRLDTGILLYKSNVISKILLSGDNGNEQHDELTVMKKYCFDNGVDTTKIYIDYAGFDTYSTMYRANTIFKVKSAILISQEYHLNRGIYIGNKLGIKSIGYSANQGKYPGYSYVCFREYFSVLKSVIDVARGREPYFSGNQININGQSNYSKNDKR